MDIEGYEPQAILGGKRFFSQLRPVFMQMEWVALRNSLKTRKDNKYASKIEDAMDFLFNDTGFQPTDINGGLLTWDKCLTWGSDIFLKLPKIME